MTPTSLNIDMCKLYHNLSPHSSRHSEGIFIIQSLITLRIKNAKRIQHYNSQIQKNTLNFINKQAAGKKVFDPKKSTFPRSGLQAEKFRRLIKDVYEKALIFNLIFSFFLLEKFRIFKALFFNLAFSWDVIFLPQQFC